MGGVISAVTKSGTNDYHGLALLNFEGSGMSGDQILSAGVAHQLADAPHIADRLEHVRIRQLSGRRPQPRTSLASPSAVRSSRTRCGSSARISRRSRTTSARWTRRTAQQPGRGRRATPSRTSKSSTSPRTRRRRSATTSAPAWRSTTAGRRHEGLLADAERPRPGRHELHQGHEVPELGAVGRRELRGHAEVRASASGAATTSRTQRLQRAERAALHLDDDQQHRLPGRAGRPAARHGLLEHPDQHQRLQRSRPADARVLPRRRHVYLHGGGEHQIKFGVQADRVGNNVLSGELRPRVTHPLGHGCPDRATTIAGTYGYYSVRSNDADPNTGFITQGDIHTNNIGLFVQDAWTMNNRLTVNVGLRTEREEVPTYTSGLDANGDQIPKFGVNFGFGDKLAPRVGSAYDLKGDGKWKVFASWGMFYDIFKLELPRGSFGGDKWIEYYYTLDTFDWPNLLVRPAARRRARARSSAPPTSASRRSGPTRCEPNLKPMQQRGVHRRPRPRAERHDGGGRALRPQAARSRGRGHGLPDADGQRGLRHRQPQRRADVAGVHRIPTSRCRSRSGSTTASSSTLDKRFANNWSLRASYLWSRLYGNYSGLSQSDENGRTSPNVGRGYDYPAMMFDQHRQPVLRPARHGSPAPVQGAGDLPVQLRHGARPERVPLERPAGDA